MKKELIAKIITTMLSVGIVLFPVHNKQQPLLEYGVFAPHIAIGLMMLGVNLTLSGQKWDWGNKYIAIPMGLIIGSMWARLIVAPSMETVSAAAMGTLLAALYFATRMLGKKILVAMLPALIIETITVLGQAIFYPANYAGGIITTYELPGMGMANYDIAIGFMIFALLLIEQKYYWWLSALTVPAVILTGAGEGLISLGILGVFGIIRRDWSKKLIPLAVSLVLLFSVGLASGILPKLYSWGIITVKTIPDLEGFNASPDRRMGEQAFWGRIRVWRESLDRLAPLGNGYEVVKFTGDTVHNVPLIIVDQLGIVAALSWLWISLYCLIKTKYRYLWVGILSLGIFDHFIWTQLAPFWWIAVGISTTVPKESDLVFRQNEDRN